MRSKVPPKFRTEAEEARFWDVHRLKGYFEDAAEDVGLDTELREAILKGRRRRSMQPISIKLDPAYVQAIRRIATQKDVPYQVLIRQWLAEALRRELGLSSRSRSKHSRKGRSIAS